MRRKADKVTHIFCDIDGTLLNSRHQVTERTRRALTALKARGVTVILISARPPRAMLAIREESGASDTMLCCAGAIVCEGMEIISALSIPPAAARQVCLAVRGAGLSLSLYRHWDWYVDTYDRWAQQESAIVGFEPAVIPFPTLLDRWERAGEGPSKLLIMGDAARIAALTPAMRAAVHGQADLVLSKPTYLEMLPPFMDKGEALRTYCARRAVPLGQTMACGDQDVDIPLLKAAGFSLAMANGSVGAKAAATCIAPSNDEDGLAVALEELFG